MHRERMTSAPPIRALRRRRSWAEGSEVSALLKALFGELRLPRAEMDHR